MSRFLILAALPFLAGTALAQGAPALQAHYPGVSPAGNAVLTRQLQQGDAPLKTLVAQSRDTAKELQLALQRPTLDVEQFAGLMKRNDALQAQIRARQTGRILIALRGLPAGDRLPFLKAIAGGQAQAAAQPR